MRIDYRRPPRPPEPPRTAWVPDIRIAPTLNPESRSAEALERMAARHLRKMLDRDKHKD